MLEGNITGTSTVEATLTVSGGIDQVVAIGTASEHESATTVVPSTDDLPKEVIAECLQLGIGILSPDEHGKWPVSVATLVWWDLQRSDRSTTPSSAQLNGSSAYRMNGRRGSTGRKTSNPSAVTTQYGKGF